MDMRREVTTLKTVLIGITYTDLISKCKLQILTQIDGHFAYGESLV